MLPLLCRIPQDDIARTIKVKPGTIMKRNIELLQESPFFEVFEREDLAELARQAEMRTFAPGDLIVREGAAANFLYMLVVGKVRLWFSPPTPEGEFTGDPSPARKHSEDEGEVLIHSISEPGRPIGWSAMVPPYRYRTSASALEETQMLGFSSAFLRKHSEENPRFGVTLMKRILWVLGNRLRATRVQFIARRFERSTLAIRALLDQSREVLPVTSPLHKIPYYLENRLTLVDAFQALELLQVHGDEQERILASLCLEILASLRKEMRLYQHLQKIYDIVASAPPTADPVEIRRRCCLEFIKLFSQTSYRIKGEENLPDKPGHIIIMNHLANHPVNTLPNEFQLTLDTHFVSAMILFHKYGQGPVRVIRRSQPHEGGHQRYYDRLGYIYVHRSHVDPEEELLPGTEERRLNFLEQACDVLTSGTNLVICPEGNSTSTENSPLPFRAGAFRISSHVQPEPFIIPIAVANFDKRITQHSLKAIIYPPFRLSEVVEDPTNPKQLYAFVNAYNKTYKTYVQEAINLPGA